METLNRLVSESFARHGFDRPLDYRRLHWSQWLPCESPRSLLLVPSKPGIFALAEEFVAGRAPASPAFAVAEKNQQRIPLKFAMERDNREGHDFTRPRNRQSLSPALAAAESYASSGIGGPAPKRMLAVLQFCEDDDMAFVLDRMFSCQNPMRARLTSGRCFVRFVVLEDQSQRRSICNALNQWLISSSEVTTGIGAHFASSLELSDQSVGRTLLSASAAAIMPPAKAVESAPKTHLQSDVPKAAAPQLDSGAAANIHCPSPFPSGF